MKFSAATLIALLGIFANVGFACINFGNKCINGYDACCEEGKKSGITCASNYGQYLPYDYSDGDYSCCETAGNNRCVDTKTDYTFFLALLAIGMITAVAYFYVILTNGAKRRVTSVNTAADHDDAAVLVYLTEQK